MLREIIQNPTLMDKHGWMDVPQAPGLGVEIDEKAVQKYRIA
jgi:L-alanine-DL-glutamate epimerase-like enolase superfamily enzyme